MKNNNIKEIVVLFDNGYGVRIEEDTQRGWWKATPINHQGEQMKIYGLPHHSISDNKSSVIWMIEKVRRLKTARGWAQVVDAIRVNR